eukprot:GHVO01003926.1.p1 GENE.GHVO01003926.1~~GHVO01003926.1.p1  ORF type:complete len:229 (+),score=26.91 GHVO01003926.1:92-778(+)
MLTMPAVQGLAILLLTCRAPFGATDALTQLKLVEYGMPKERIAFMSPFMIPLGILTPIIVSRFMRSYRPLDVFGVGYALRLLLCFGSFGLVGVANSMAARGMPIPPWFLYPLFAVSALYNICQDVMFVSQMGFFAKVADPAIGGTYMTFLNTVANLGNKWPSTTSMLLLERLTVRRCPPTGVCEALDGYYPLVMCSVLTGGGLWYFTFRKRLRHLEDTPAEGWTVSQH